MKILLVDDESLKRELLKDQLVAAGHETASVGSAMEADKCLDKCKFDVVVADLRMPGENGLAFMKRVRTREVHPEFIIMTAYGSVDSAVDAMRSGAYDYMQKPFSGEELLLKLDRLQNLRLLQEENYRLRQHISHRVGETKLIGESDPMRMVKSRIHAVAHTDSIVMLEGESGTGKEVVARRIHEVSRFAGGPFVPVSCASLPRDLLESELFGHEKGAFSGAVRRRAGRFELAHGGTLFLDDVDDIPFDVQVKLLRAIETQKIEPVGGETHLHVNTRTIAATKCNLLMRVREGKFREDLYYRLSVIPIHLPPLRERLDDIHLLLDHFAGNISMRLGWPQPEIKEGVVQRLSAYDWPGNVREFEHIIEQAIVLYPNQVLTPACFSMLPEGQWTSQPFRLSMQGRTRIDLHETLRLAERELLLWAMKKHKSNVARAAASLSLPRSTFQY